MLDLRYVLDHTDPVRESLRQRGVTFDLAPVSQLDDRRRRLQKEHDELRHRQNEVSAKVAQLKKGGGDPSALVGEMKGVADRVRQIGVEGSQVEGEIRNLLLQIPNIPHESVPLGAGPDQNREVRRWGEARRFSFQPRQHWEIGEELGILDFERASKISGSRFAILRGSGAALERALITFMIELHRERGYTEIQPPFLVNAECLVGTGQLPKFEADLFKTTTGHYLVPTAEVPVTNLFRGEILDSAALPISFVAHTPCFRSEAGSYGKDIRGLIRQHQFNKVELVKFCLPETSYEMLERLTSDAEEVLRRLEIPYRVVTLCTGDLGFAAAKTYDLEAWFPAQGLFRELSSCSNFEAFQARRAEIRFRRAPKSKPEYLHTLNGSGLAVGRTFAAILENFQEEDGSVRVPEALRQAVGSDRIEKDKG